MGVQSMDAKMWKYFKFGFPAISFAFTFWLPASVQLAFFCTGVLSAAQSVLFRYAPFRTWANMTPLSSDPNPGTPTKSTAYKGLMKIRAEAPVPAPTKSDGALGDIMNGWQKAKKVMDTTTESTMKKHREQQVKQERKLAAQYEAKRQKEEKEAKRRSEMEWLEKKLNKKK